MQRFTTQTFLLLPALFLMMLMSLNFNGCTLADGPTSNDGYAQDKRNNGKDKHDDDDDDDDDDNGDDNGDDNDNEHNGGNDNGNPPSGPCAAPGLSFQFNTDNSITVKVTAPSSGLPNGFTLYWVSTEDYANSGWHGCDDNSFCKVEFRKEVAPWNGVFSGSQFALAPGATINVEIGSTVRAGGITGPGCLPLSCGKSYVIKGSNPECDELESEVTASTRTCDNGNGGHCTYSQGYWKNHTPWPAPYSPTAQWFNSGSATWMSMLSDPPQGDKYKILAKQYIAALINGANGSSANYTVTLANNTQITIAQILTNSTNYYSGQGALSPSLAEEYASFLEEYNTGDIGPGHCD